MPTQDTSLAPYGFEPYKPRALIMGPYTIRFPRGAVKRRFTFAEAIDLATGTDATVLDASGEIVLQDISGAYRASDFAV